MMAVKNNIPARRTRSHQNGFRWLMIISIVFCGLLTHTWIRTESTQTMIRISEAEKKLLKMLSYQKELSLEIDHLKSEDRIRRIARSRLDLLRDIGENTHYISMGSDNG